MRRVPLAFLTIAVVATLVLSVEGYYVSQTRHLVRQNQERITENRARTSEIQASRLASCRRTYEGIREVFKPFFPPPPRTAQQQRDLDKFNHIIDKRKGECDAQTSTKEAR